MMYLGNAGESGGGGGRIGLQNGPTALARKKAPIYMAIINIIGRDADSSRILAGAMCLWMSIAADCTLKSLISLILQATNPQMPVNRVLGHTLRGMQNRGMAP